MNKYKETARHKQGKIESTGKTRVTKETVTLVALVFSYIRICSVRLLFEAIPLTDICIVTHPCTLFTSNEPSV